MTRGFNHGNGKFQQIATDFSDYFTSVRFIFRISASANRNSRACDRFCEPSRSIDDSRWKQKTKDRRGTKERQICSNNWNNWNSLNSSSKQRCCISCFPVAYTCSRMWEVQDGRDDYEESFGIRMAGGWKILKSWKFLEIIRLYAQTAKISLQKFTNMQILCRRIVPCPN